MSDGGTTHTFHHLQLLSCYFQAPFVLHLGGVTTGAISRSSDASCRVTPQETAKPHNSLLDLPHHTKKTSIRTRIYQICPRFKAACITVLAVLGMKVCIPHHLSLANAKTLH